jgi:hypothetical protein
MHFLATGVSPANSAALIQQFTQRKNQLPRGVFIGVSRCFDREGGVMRPNVILFESVGDAIGSLDAVQLSRTEVAINHWADIAAAWLDRYIVTSLLGPNGAAVESAELRRGRD